MAATAARSVRPWGEQRAEQPEEEEVRLALASRPRRKGRSRTVGAATAGWKLRHGAGTPERQTGAEREEEGRGRE